MPVLIILGGQDVTVTGNDFSDIPVQARATLLWNCSNIIENTLPGGLDVSGNSFGGAGADCGIVFKNLRDLHLWQQQPEVRLMLYYLQ